MPKSKPSYIAFNAGEFGAEALARVDLQTYDRGAEIMENIIPLVQGGMTKAPGTVFVNLAAISGTSDPLTGFDIEDLVLRPFVFSEDQAFMLEHSAGNTRIYFTDQGRVTCESNDATTAGWTDESGVTSTGGGVPPIILPEDFDIGDIRF